MMKQREKFLHSMKRPGKETNRPGNQDKTSEFHDSECICEVEEFPLTKNGKIDRKKLEEAYESGNLTNLS